MCPRIGFAHALLARLKTSQLSVAYNAISLKTYTIGFSGLLQTSKPGVKRPVQPT